jgi:hypothetical protein
MWPIGYYGECRKTVREPAMLNPFIIDQIKRREQEERRRRDRQPVIELPVQLPAAPRPASEEDEPGERGVFIIDLF